MKRTGDGSLDRIFAGLYPFVSRPVHEYLEDFQFANPGLHKHRALRCHVPVVRCIAKHFDIPMEAKDRRLD